MKQSATLLSIVFFVVTTLAEAEDLAESIPESIYQARVSIIIDDLGYNLKQAHLLAAFPYALTIAVIPFAPYSTDVAKIARRFDKEVMLHAPMETLNQKKWENGLSSKMGEAELAQMIDKMLASVPHARGVNNHGGSKLTQDEDRMRWIMSHLEKRALYFIDSRTTASTTAILAASDTNVAHDSRDVFLDNEKNHEYIRNQIRKLADVALEKGSAIGIGHPYPETIAILSEELPKFGIRGIQIVNASQIATINDKVTPNTSDLQHVVLLE